MASKKLVVEVIRAFNLLPKDGQGSCSPYVTVEFNGMRLKTRVIIKDLNPVWEERLEFPLTDLLSVDLENELLEAVVLCGSKKPAGKKAEHFLGRVKVLGNSFVRKGEEALIFHKLQKKGPWLYSWLSPVRGELGLRVYYVQDHDGGGAAPLPEEPPKVEAPPEQPPKADEPPKADAPKVEDVAPKEPPPKVEEGPPKVENTASEGLPQVEEVPPKVEEVPPKVDKAPPKVEEAPSKVEEGGPPKVEEGGPPKVEDVPPKVEEVPPKVEDAPPKAEEVPPNADGKPGTNSEPPAAAPTPPPPPPAPAPPPEAPPKEEAAQQAPEEKPPQPPPDPAAPPKAEAPPHPPPPVDNPPQVFESVAKASHEPAPSALKASLARSASAPLHSMSIPPPLHHHHDSDYSLRDTTPSLGGNTPSPHTLVEQMHYLFVKVVKARSLVRNAARPYVRLVLGNKLTRTRTAPNGTPSPLWNEVFAFGGDGQIQSGILEVSTWDEGIATEDDFLGVAYFDLAEVPTRTPPDSPLAPQWYRLEQKRGEIGKVSGDIMLAVWIGTHADEAFADAWQSDTGGYFAATRAKVYLSPRLWYLRVNVIEAQDLQFKSQGGRHQLPDVSVKVQLGFQIARTRVAKRRSVSPFWNEDLLLVASEPFEDALVLTVEDHHSSNKHEVLGVAKIPIDGVERRVDDRKVATKWFNLQPSLDGPGTAKFQGRVHLRMCFDGGYHVMDETTHLSSDLRPSARQLWKAPVGVFELGILGAHNLLPMKTKDGRGATDAYCVAKYGPKWVRTRTILDNLSPRWNEQYTWEVYDPCTVLTLCVFDNGELEHEKEGGPPRHSRFGKVRVRLSTLELNRVYTVSYPLLVLQPGGLKKMGDIEVAMRFSCVSMFNLVCTYANPMLPRMHYLHPMTVQQQEMLRGAAMKMVAMRLSRAEPPLRPEVIHYVLDSESGNFSLRRSKANWHRISSILGGVYSMARWVQDIRQWRRPTTTLLVHVLVLILLCYPELILPTLFFYLFLIGTWQYRVRARAPPHMDPRLSHADVAAPDELDEEFDSVPTARPPEVVLARYERLRGLAGRVQVVLGDVATQAERAQGLLAWRDPRATLAFVVACLCSAVLLYVVPFRFVGFLLVMYYLRHPRFREALPSTFLNFYRRLPAQSDRIL